MAVARRYVSGGTGGSPGPAATAPAELFPGPWPLAPSPSSREEHHEDSASQTLAAPGVAVGQPLRLVGDALVAHLAEPGGSASLRRQPPAGLEAEAIPTLTGAA